MSDREDSFSRRRAVRDARFGRAIREVEGSPSPARLELLRARIAASTIALLEGKRDRAWFEWMTRWARTEVALAAAAAVLAAVLGSATVIGRADLAADTNVATTTSSRASGAGDASRQCRYARRNDGRLIGAGDERTGGPGEWRMAFDGGGGAMNLQKGRHLFSELPISSRSPRLRARPGASRAMAIALLAIVALAGMGLGFAADRLAMHGRHQEMRRGGPGGPGFGPMEGRRGRDGRRGGDGMRERFAHELDLTPEQQQRVDSIMSQQMADFRRIRSEMQPRFDSLARQGTGATGFGADASTTREAKRSYAIVRHSDRATALACASFERGGRPPPPFP